MPVLRFLNLASELRNRIYEEALYHDRAKGHVAAVALLRTSRQIYQEAKGIFDAQDCFTIFADCDGFLQPHQNEGLDFRLTLRGDARGIVEGWDLQHELRRIFPSSILKMRKIQVQIRIRAKDKIIFVPRGSFFWPCPQAIVLFDALARLLNSDVQARQVHVTIEDSEVYKHHRQLFNADFIHLADLHPRHEVKVSGIDDGMMALLQQARARRFPASRRKT